MQNHIETQFRLIIYT